MIDDAKILICDIQPGPEQSVVRWVANKFGLQAALELIETYGGDSYYIPTMDDATEHAVRRSAEKMLSKGMSVQDVRKITCLSKTTLYRLQKPC